MKILVISLLRLGDIILSTPVLKGLRANHSDAEIDLLVNKQFEKIYPLIPEVRKVVAFDREGLQKSLIENERSLFDAHDKLRDLVEVLNAEKYDLIINLTHNRLSGWIMSLLQSTEKRGISIQPNGSIQFGSPWFRYLNDYITSGRKDIFHYIDVFCYGTGVSRSDRSLCLNENDDGHRKAEKLLYGSSKDIIAIQPFTSETKKNWGMTRFETALKILAQLNPGYTYVVLGAPDEEDELRKFVQDLENRGVPARLAICSLDTAFSILKRAKLLVTGDTSIKHLACAAGTKIVELSLGSSFYQKTGAYLEGSVILQARVNCAPCPHRTPCSQPTHRCAEQISAEVVALTCSKVLNNEIDQLRVVAHEFYDEVELLITSSSETGDWAAYPLSEDFKEQNIVSWLDRASWKMLLNKTFEQKIAPYGSECGEICNLLFKTFPDQSLQDWRHAFENIEKYFERLESGVAQLVQEMRTSLRRLDDPKEIFDFYERLKILKESMKDSELGGSYFVTLEKSLEEEFGSGFLRARRVSEVLGDMQKRASIELKLVRSLKLQMAEII